MSDLNEVTLPYRYYPDFTTGRPVANGYIYIGVIDTDPEITARQVSVKAVQENGTSVTISQPIRTSAGGVPQLNGSPVQLVVEGAHSIKVLNSRRSQVYYAPSIVGGMRPSTIIRSQLVPLSISLTDRFVNTGLFLPNILLQVFYNTFGPNMDLGNAGDTSLTIENIPEQRIDLAQGNYTLDLGA